MAEKTKKKLAVMLSKSAAEVNKEVDSLLEKATKRVKKTIADEALTAVDLNLSINSLKIIRDERMEIRGELTPIQKAKHDLDREKFEHKKEMDYKSKGGSSGKAQEKEDGNTVHLG